MSSIANEDTRVPVPDPPHVLKPVRSGLFNYWFLHGNYLINLKLLRSAREDSNQAISKPIAQSLPRSCIRNKDQMNMTTAVGLFKENLLNVLPDDPLVCTLVPEQDRLWRQNPAKSILKFPTAVAFSSKHSILIITDKAKSMVYMANMHNRVCIIPIAGPGVGICSPTGLAIRDNYVIVVNSGAQTSFKVVDIPPIVQKSRDGCYRLSWTMVTKWEMKKAVSGQRELRFTTSSFGQAQRI